MKVQFVCIVAVLALVVSAEPVNDGSKIVSCALAQVDKWPYSWGGGDDHGPTHGLKMVKSPYCDDRNVKGFDCSGLSKYCVYQGTGISVPHTVDAQHKQCKNLRPSSEIKPGDLVFYDYYHVAIFIGNNEMVEAVGHDAQCHGILMKRTGFRTRGLLPNVCRMW